VEAVTSLMLKKEASGKVFNIGSDNEMTIEQLADMIIDVTGSKSKKQFISYEQAYGRRIEDMLRRKPSLDRINAMIGWAPKTSLEQTLEMVVDFEKTQSA
jgi:UDP-glucose 4-epimerase